MYTKIGKVIASNDVNGKKGLDSGGEGRARGVERV
jgi:hypothetical protein